MKYLSIILLFCAVSVSAQVELPDRGEISEIKSFTNFYLVSESTKSRKLILKSLKKNKSLREVTKPEEAQFFIEFKELSRQGTFGSGSYEERSEMIVYYLREKKKVVAWSETETYIQSSGMSFEKPNETVLTQKFLKSLSRAKTD